MRQPYTWNGSPIVALHNSSQKLSWLPSNSKVVVEKRNDHEATFPQVRFFSRVGGPVGSCADTYVFGLFPHFLEFHLCYLNFLGTFYRVICRAKNYK